MDRIQCTHGVLRLRSGIRKKLLRYFSFRFSPTQLHRLDA